jgi:hypothetical protein
VDRGFILDGVTTITELASPAPCNAGPDWSGWWCVSLRSDANTAEGPPYEIHVRWNLPDAAGVNASFTWMIGGASVGFFRTATTEAARIQDTLAAEGVRTIECSFIGNGTYTAPANGYPSISAVYADVLEHLTAVGLMEGVRGHFGNSGGSLMAANALAYHHAEKLLDGVVFGSGAFWSDLEEVCTQPASPMYGDPTIRDRADQLGWLTIEGTAPCLAGAPTAFPSYACRSLLGPDADRDYPDLMLSVMVGTMDTEFPWFDASVTEYLQGVTAFKETFDHPASEHNMMMSPAGADTVLARIRDIVAGTNARRGGPPAGSGDARGPRLAAAAPNPLRNGTLLHFRLPQPGDAQLTVHDVTGRRVALLLDAPRGAGEHAVRWNAADDAGRAVASGLYFVRLRTADGQSVIRLQVVR